MLCRNNYAQEYIDACRSKIDGQVSSFKAVVTAGVGLRGQDRAQFDRATVDFEPVFFNSMVLVLDNYFVHRSRMLEKKDGNALNEVRVLCTSLTSNDGRLAADKQIKLDPARSVMGYQLGDQIAVREDDFRRLAQAFFAEMESKFLDVA